MDKRQLEKISKATNISVKELNRLNRNNWYHGTTIQNAENIARVGVIANYNVGSQLDFGRGFYLTHTYERAESYITRVPVLKADGTFTRPDEWAIIEFRINPCDILLGSINSYNYKNFPKHDRDFAEFVFQNRVNNVYNEHPHEYDVIWGVMSDNFPNQVILDYKNHLLLYDEALAKLQKPNSMKQLYISNQDICDMLIINRIYYNRKGETS